VLITAAGPDGIVVEITDGGLGIPAPEREQVVARFVRLDASREQGSGSAGLGLAIAWAIVTARTATIVLTEAEGRNPSRRHLERHRGRGRRNHGPFGMKSFR
jgi:signal transduction histidine kinase